MPVHNSYIGDVFNQLADLLEIEGSNPFRIRAYRNAARVVAGWPQSISGIIAKGEELPKIPGLGADLSAKMEEIVATGTLELLKEVEKRVPKGLSALLRIPGLGPKRVLALKSKLGVNTLQDLKKVAEAGKIQELPRFGEKIEEKILQVVRHTENVKERILYAAAEQITAPFLDYLKATPEVHKVIVAGSFRRRRDTVGDLDLLVCSDEPKKIMEKFVHYDEVDEIIARGESKSSVLLRSRVQVDLRVVPEKSYGSALHYFTGSKAHNIAIRMLGVRRGLKVNEYGVFRENRRIGGKTEEEVYRSVGLPYIEPELREARGEIEAARENRLPNLVTLEDIRGDLHVHTDATDGRLSLKGMVDVARKKGYSYLAITDHSKHLTVARGLNQARLKQQIEQIDRMNSKLKGFQILKGIEVDILENGKLDLPDDILKELDLTVCSIHFKFDLSEKNQTERILRAMDNPCCKILGHPTGRLIGRRKSYEVNLEKIFKAAKERGIHLEVNAQPDRMDLDDIYCKMAKDMGVRVAISTDAHSGNDLDGMRFGVYQARRGWLEKGDVINTRKFEDLKKLFKR